MAQQKPDEKEAAYLYDLVLLPQWRERFDAFVDDTIKLPEKGTVLEIGSGTGAYAIDLAVRGGHDLSVRGIESNAAMRLIAQGKADIQRVKRVTFQAGKLTETDAPSGAFALVLADASLAPPTDVAAIVQEAARVADKGATVAVKLTTRGSFDEFFSIYWEALYELDWLDATPGLEGLVTERLSLSEVEDFAKAAQLKQIRAEVRREAFTFADGPSFMTDPLMQHWFLPGWLALFPEAKRQARVTAKLIELIDRTRAGLAFEISVRVTLLTAQK